AAHPAARVGANSSARRTPSMKALVQRLHPGHLSGAPPKMAGGPIEALPATIKAGLKDLMVAFSGPTPEGDDRLTLVRIYADAASRFCPAIAEVAIERLRFHNPRNPFRPTPQDLFEHCEKTQKAWA